MRLHGSQTGIEWGGYGVWKSAVTLFLGTIRARDQPVIMTHTGRGGSCALETQTTVQMEEIDRARANVVRGVWVIPMSLLAQGSCSIKR